MAVEPHACIDIRARDAEGKLDLLQYPMAGSSSAMAGSASAMAGVEPQTGPKLPLTPNRVAQLYDKRARMVSQAKEEKWFKLFIGACAIDARLEKLQELQPDPKDTSISKRAFNELMFKWKYDTESEVNRAVLGWLHQPQSRTVWDDHHDGGGGRAHSSH